MLKVRLAIAADIEFATQGSGLPKALVTRKIRGQEVFVALEDSIRVGCLHLDYLWSRVPYVSFLAVRPEEPTGSAARVLFAFTQRSLWNRGYEVLLSSSRIGQPPQGPWHRQLGFIPSGIITGIPALGNEMLYRKELR